MSQKLLMPCIYLCREKAVAGLDNDEVIHSNPLELAQYYSDHQADGLLIFDLSSDDEEHEAALDIIKSICSAIAIPVIGAGNVKRMEDVKKLLYAGCLQVILNASKPSSVGLAGEASARFGKDRILVSVNNVDFIFKRR